MGRRSGDRGLHELLKLFAGLAEAEASEMVKRGEKAPEKPSTQSQEFHRRYRDLMDG